MLSILGCGKSADTTNTGPTPAGATVYITSSMTFSPNVVTIKKGTRVTWRNSDNVVHTVTSGDGTTLRSPDILVGGTYTITPTIVGTFTYHCTHHSSMTGELRVNE